MKVVVAHLVCQLLGNNSFQNLGQERQTAHRAIIFQAIVIWAGFLRTGEMMADLKDSGTTPDVRDAFTREVMDGMRISKN